MRICRVLAETRREARDASNSFAPLLEKANRLLAMLTVSIGATRLTLRAPEVHRCYGRPSTAIAARAVVAASGALRLP